MSINRKETDLTRIASQLETQRHNLIEAAIKAEKMRQEILYGSFHPGVASTAIADSFTYLDEQSRGGGARNPIDYGQIARGLTKTELVKIEEPDTEQMHVGPFSLSYETHEIIINGPNQKLGLNDNEISAPFVLPNNQFRTLWILMANNGHIVPYDRINDWVYNADGIIHDSSLKTNLSHLRSAIGDEETKTPFRFKYINSHLNIGVSFNYRKHTIPDQLDSK